MDKMRMETPNLTDNNIEKIGELFPNCITEAIDENGNLKKAINFDILKQMLSEDINEGPENYEFTWVGKKAAMVEANRPIRKTLRPCPEESVNWDTTENLYIEGDNLEALKLLQESYLEKVKMIYIDPPYNTGNDFIYKDDFKKSKADYEEEQEFIDDEGNRLIKNTESNGRFHSDWCSMMYSRLYLAKNLLSKDGLIFINISDNELENLKKIGIEIFGEKNFIGQWNWYKSATPPNLSKKIKKNIEYILCFEKKSNDSRYKGIKKYSTSTNGLLNQTNKFTTLHFPEKIVRTGIEDGYLKSGAYGTKNYKINLLNDIEIKDGIIISSFKLQAKFKWSQENLNKEINKGTIIEIRTKTLSPSYDKLEYDPEVPPNIIDKNVNVDTTEEAGKYLKILFNGKKVFDYPKPVQLIKYLMNFIDTKNSIILDFFSGSSTTAEATMELNREDDGKRKYIMVQIPELVEKDTEAFQVGYKNICEIGKERIRRAVRKLAEENPDAEFDGGFRVLKVDESNMKDVYYSAEEYSQDLISMMESNIKEDRSDLDLLFGCLTEWGVQLNLPYRHEVLFGKKVYMYSDTDLMACFEENINEDLIREIARRKPLRVIFRDSCFKNSQDKINVIEIFKYESPMTEIKVI